MRLEYDRGTIICVQTEAEAYKNVAQLPGMQWDKRTGVFRAEAERYAEICRALNINQINFFDTIANDLNTKLVWKAIPLRPYQEAALTAWQLNGNRGLVVLPTGSGKTRVALAAAAQLMQPTLVLVPTRVLLEQWITAISNFYGGTIGCVGDGIFNIASVTVTTYASAWRHMPLLGKHFGLLIIDEAHHLGSGLPNEVMAMSVAPARLGITATPSTTLIENNASERLLGPLVYQLTIADLAGKYLADFDSIVLWVKLTADEREAYLADRQIFLNVYRRFCMTHSDPSWQEFIATARRSDIGRCALTAHERSLRLLRLTKHKEALVANLLSRHADARVLVFTSDNYTAYKLARFMLIMPITCDINRSERRDALMKFRIGELSALVSAQVLNEGIDIPDADVAIIVGSSRGEREHVQRVGRLLRPSIGKRAIVYELVTSATNEVSKANKRRKGLGNLNPI
ncbi:MAG: DEAD/DEAH box helicase family protein [Deltaproteobacteria bacterium]|nr:DEAD/DEAH box helicase family protein [Deltaproteobacteria bacterium]